jgi:23S rRNA (cytosine1962-C5)-methyltransferase
MLQEAGSGLPIVSISHRGVDRLRAGHVWVYRSDVVQAENVQPGSVVLVQEHTSTRGKPTSEKTARPTRARVLGTALYSSASEIALRMISRGTVDDIEQLVRERIRTAIAYRDRFVRDTNAYRVIFSEGDFLPGVIVDRYNDLLSVQVLTQAMDSAAIRATFLDELRLALQPRTIVERVDARVRKLEQLPEKESEVIWEVSAGAGLIVDCGVTGVSPVGDKPAGTSNKHVGAGALARPAAPRAALGEQR